MENEFGTAITVVGTCPVLQRYVGYEYKKLKLENENKECLDYSELEKALKKENADYLLISRLTMSGLLEAVFAKDDPPSFLETVLKHKDVAVYRYINTE